MDPNRPIYHQLNITREKSVTVMGLIGEELGRLLWDLAESTNKIAVENFFITCIKYVRDPRNTVIVMDNHSAHVGASLMSLFAENGVIILNLPPHSSPLNPIENVSIKTLHYHI